MKNAPDTTADGFPEPVQFKSCLATIYRARNRQSNRYEVRYHDADGLRRRDTFLDYELAKKHALAVVRELASGGLDLLTLRGAERRIYERALDLLQPLGLALDEIAAEAVDLRRRLHGVASPVEAVDYYLKTRPKIASNVSVRSVVNELIESRLREEAGTLHLRDLRDRLGRFADAFQTPISFITPLDIDRYLNALDVSPRTRYNHRGTIGTLMRFAKERGYLPVDFGGLLRNGKKRTFSRKVVVFTPEEMLMLLTGAKPAVIVPLAITAFSGVRAEEVKRLEWKHVKLAKGYIEIPAPISKTRIRRLAPLPSNLKAWLTAQVQTEGPVCVYKNLSNQYLKLARRVGIKWKRNALRHSFVSYRVADINNIPQVAMESGHTVRELQTDYLVVVDKEAATNWFSILPTAPLNVLPLVTSAQQKDSETTANAAAST